MQNSGKNLNIIVSSTAVPFIQGQYVCKRQVRSLKLAGVLVFWARHSVVDPGEGRSRPPYQTSGCLLLSPLSIAKPSPGSNKMYFSEPEITQLEGSIPPLLPTPNTSVGQFSFYFTFSGKPWDPPYQNFLDPPLTLLWIHSLHCYY